VIRTKDCLLLLIVTFISVAFILPEDSILRGLDRTYLFAVLLIILTIALVHYSKLVLVTAVLIAAMGANLPEELARMLTVDARIFMIALIAVLLVAMANHIIKLPTGLDKPQGFPAGKGSVAPNPNIVELNLPESNGPELNSAENNDPESSTPEDSDPVHDSDLKSGVLD